MLLSSGLCLRQQILDCDARDKRSSLFILFVSGEEKKFNNIDYLEAQVTWFWKVYLFQFKSLPQAFFGGWGREFFSILKLFRLKEN